MSRKYLIIGSLISFSVLFFILSFEKERIHETTVFKEKCSTQAPKKERPEPVRYPQDFFAWPIRGEIDLSGNFGEIRTNHFHSGLDIRTNKGQTGIPVYASGDGYIGRINVSPYGYGNALYIVHPNGYTTVYGHLERFVHTIESYVTGIQYQRKEAFLELFPENSVLRIKKGDLIAYSGNTGGSAGPHLHFEIRDSKSSESIDPLLFGLKLKDISAPILEALNLYAFENTKHFETGTYRVAKIYTKNKSNETRNVKVTPGWYGLGAEWKDYLRPGSFRMGVPIARLYLEGELILEHNIKRMPFEDWRQVNCYMDHPVKELKDQRIIKLFRDNGNRLNIYPVSIQEGKFFIQAKRTYSIKVVIEDFPGYKDSAEFVLIGDDNADIGFPPEIVSIPEQPELFSRMFFPSQNNSFQIPVGNDSLRVDLPKGVLYDTINFRLGISKYLHKGHQTWEVMRSSIPVNDSFTITFKPKTPLQDPDKYIFIRLTDTKAERPEITFTKNNTLICKPKLLGNFYIVKDESGPEVKNISVGKNGFSLNVLDKPGGVNKIELALDGNWQLFQYDPKIDLVHGKWPVALKNGDHVLKILVTDRVGNKSEILKTFKL